MAKESTKQLEGRREKSDGLGAPMELMPTLLPAVSSV
jgi:hypothetical protein